jgi:prolipoprotein diacylglyceryl transferase
MFNLGDRGIRWYGFLLAMGFLLGYLIMSRVMRKEGNKQETIDKLAISVIIGVVVGLRLGHCMFYNPAYYLANPLDIFKVWEGGLASHGGAVGILIAVWLFSRYSKMSFLGLMDRIALIVPLAGGMVRIGNLMNSEIVGIPTTVPWAFVFKKLGNAPLHPTQLYEAIFYLIMFVVFYFIFMKYKSKWKDGTFLGWFIIVLFVFRYLIEFTKVDQVEFEGWTQAIKMGQLLSIPFIFLGLYFLGRGYGWFDKLKKTNK